MNDIELTQSVIEQIDEADYEHHRQYNRLNRTRFYKWLVVMLSGDVEVHMFAVKTKRDRESIAVKEVFKASVDGDVIWMRDLILMAMGGYTADWYREKLGRAYYQVCDRGRWASEPYKLTNKLWHIKCPVINPDVLSASDRFRYCSYDEASGDILDYLKMYKMHPRIESLVKSGLPHMAVKPGFVKQLETDKSFLRFVLKNLAAIKKERYGIDVIRKAYKTGITLEKSETMISARRYFRECDLPLTVDAEKAIEYIMRQRLIDKWSFCRYLQNCVRLGLDLSNTKNSFPKNFKNRERIVRAKCALLDRQERAELVAKMAADLKRVAEKYTRIERIRGTYIARLPKCDDDFMREGIKLNSCVGEGYYAERVAKGESVIVFVRKKERPNIPFVTVEYRPSLKQITQMYGKSNSKPDANCEGFINKKILPLLSKI